METITIPQSEYYELLRYREIIQSLEDMIHEPEFKKEFVKRVIEAEERVKKGEKVRVKSVDELDKHLDEMGE